MDVTKINSYGVKQDAITEKVINKWTQSAVTDFGQGMTDLN